MKRNTAKKTYYVCMLLKKEKAIISTSKQYIADIVGINTVTITRHLKRSNLFISEEFIIGICNDIHKIKRGFAL